MSTASMTFGRHPHRPRRARPVLFNVMAGALIGALRRIDQWQVRRLARSGGSAAEVLARAQQLESSSPGMAADLRAEADAGAQRN